VTPGRLRALWLAAAAVPAALALALGAGRAVVAASLAWVVGYALLELACLAIGRPRGRLARGIRRLARAGVALAALVAAGEVVWRLPPIVAYTGGHRPGILRFEAERYDRLWERNPQRLRSLHLDESGRVEEKSAGARRILALGDDVTFGTLIGSTEDTWPYVLESGLARDGVDAQVINAGRGGFTTANEAEWLAQQGARFAPDLVIVQFSVNDAVPSYPGLRAERSFYAFDLKPLLPGLHPYLVNRSYLYSALDSFREHQQMRRLHPEGFLPLYEDTAPGWRQTREALGEIAAWGKTHGAPVLLVLFPDLEFDIDLRPGRYRYASVHEQVTRVANAVGIDVLDLTPLFAEAAEAGRPIYEWYPLPCEPLPGPDVQRMAAEAIRAEIDQRGWLAAPAAPPESDTTAR
jgi:lysophospholipase L1-like esterase